jgi:hypothetical protein
MDRTAQGDGLACRWDVMETATATTAQRPDIRPLGYRLTCEPCQVAWNGDKGSPCWVCGATGSAGPGPTLYPSAASTD